MYSRYIIILISVTILILLIILYKPLYSSSHKVKGNTHIKFNKLMIVAHPDDELIFGGKELVNSGGWKVVCITNATQRSRYVFLPWIKTRKEEFVNVMNKIKANYELWDYEDYAFNSSWDTSKLEKDISDLLKNNKFDMIVTHNLKGEYGHEQHKQLSKVMHKLVKKNLYTFACGDNKNPKFDEVRELLKLHKSQQSIINKLKDYTMYQTITKVN